MEVTSMLYNCGFIFIYHEGLMDVNRRLSIYNGLNTSVAQLQFFFCLLLLRLCLVSSETSDFDRGRSKAGGE
jgi:hypothetical protein